jgi:hypothetical protein
MNQNYKNRPFSLKFVFLISVLNSSSLLQIHINFITKSFTMRTLQQINQRQQEKWDGWGMKHVYERFKILQQFIWQSWGEDPFEILRRMLNDKNVIYCNRTKGYRLGLLAQNEDQWQKTSGRLLRTECWIFGFHNKQVIFDQLTIFSLKEVSLFWRTSTYVQGAIHKQPNTKSSQGKCYIKFGNKYPKIKHGCFQWQCNPDKQIRTMII